VGAELAYLYARLGRMTELEGLLKSVEKRVFVGQATEKINGAREGLWNMQNRPEVSFRCGPLALHRIKRLTGASSDVDMAIYNSASTQKGLSLPQVAELSKKIGLNYQMAFRPPLTPSLSPSDGERVSGGRVRGVFIVPSVVHWKVGHYAAMVRQEGDLFLLEDPTFRNSVWATRAALEAETSGYFLIPPGALPKGWRTVEAAEGETIWGKGNISNKDDRRTRCKDHKTGGSNSCNDDDDCKGMAVSSVHLMLVSLNLRDQPLGYTPPVGPPVKFTLRYNQRDAYQPANFDYSNFGPKWTCDWFSFITDNTLNPLVDVNCYMPGGGVSTFTGFNTNTQTFAHEQYDQSLLKRTGPNSYELISRDGSKLIYSHTITPTGFRRVFLTHVVDAVGNAVTLGYDGSNRLLTITDAIGQVTVIEYLADTGDNMYTVSKVTDPFGRFATFAYGINVRLARITDVIGLTSEFKYYEPPNSPPLAGTNYTDQIVALITPYGTNTFITASGPGTTRSLETIYPDGTRDRVEFNQSNTLGIAVSDPVGSVPQGMSTINNFLWFRNTFHWDRNACAQGYGDYTKARIYHWLHTEDQATASGVLESTKEPLENRVWYDYPGQSSSIFIGTSDRPTHVGRALDDGSTQLHTYAYDGFGHVTNSIDPLGRTMSYIYSTNGIDLLEVRQTRAGNNELLSKTTYNAQHLPLTLTDAAGQTTTNNYNARGQLLTTSNPKGEAITYTYDANGYLTAVDGPSPGTSDTVTMTYDSFGRTRTKTEVSGYTLTFSYDGLDRLTNITFPDGTDMQFTFDRLDMVAVRDRAGRETLMEYDQMQQMVKKTDPLGRVTRYEWCSCGDLRSLIDPMGRITSWNKDVQGRLVSKQYGDGSQVSYIYENATSRLRQTVDEKQQVAQYSYYRDDTLRAVGYANSAITTSGVSYTYDPNYERVVSMTDGTGATLYSYNPISAAPTLGAGELASVDGPLPNDTITYGYDELGRRISTAINGVASLTTYDAAGRMLSETNLLGTFSYAYDGASGRLLTNVSPNGLIAERGYGGNLEDRELQRITHRVGSTPISEFLYGRDHTADRIITWSQQAGAQLPDLYTFGYNAVDQLLSATITNAGTLINSFAYSYDFADNRLLEQVGASNFIATYNALNQISTTTAAGARTNEWDAEDRLVAVTTGNQRTEFTYDGMDRMVSIRHLTNGVEASLRRLVWCDNELCEERDAAGGVTKRFFEHGMKVESGPVTGAFVYTRDHLGSVRELTDAGGNVRARYAYDPWGRRTKLTGDADADIGFAGMFSPTAPPLAITRFRAYDPELGRWLSRDPLEDAELKQGVNLYAYVADNPVNLVDPLGLEACCLRDVEWYATNLEFEFRWCKMIRKSGRWLCRTAYMTRSTKKARIICYAQRVQDEGSCLRRKIYTDYSWRSVLRCLKGCPGSKPCSSASGPPPPGPFGNRRSDRNLNEDNKDVSKKINLTEQSP